VSGQRLTIRDPGGLFDFLNSYYRTNWYGPLMRASVHWRAGGRWSLTGVMTYHQLFYRADADWNLISDFSHPVSFRQRADGFGIVGELAVQYRVRPRMDVFFAARGFEWETGRGIDELYHPDAASQQTQLNEVIARGFGLGGGVRVRLSTVGRGVSGPR
jgi:hypothetical protein